LLGKFTLDEFAKYSFEYGLCDISMIKWILPGLALFIFLVLLFFWVDMETGTSKIVYFIQDKAHIAENLRELEIELYYITSILESREKG
jgi:hypothetical protein